MGYIVKEVRPSKKDDEGCPGGKNVYNERGFIPARVAFSRQAGMPAPRWQVVNRAGRTFLSGEKLMPYGDVQQ